MQIFNGPDKVLACPSCGKPKRFRTYSFVDEIGEEKNGWSDGKETDPTMPDVPHVTRCGHCGTFFWIVDATVLGELGGPGSYAIHLASQSSQEWEAAPYAELLDASDLAEAVATASSPEQAKHSRIQLWHLLNDPSRENSFTDVQKPASFFANLEALVQILDEAVPYEQILKAEALRELGRHKEALDLLRRTGEMLRWKAEQIYIHAKAGSTAVFRFMKPE
jgi:hypothetical protein